MKSKILLFIVILTSILRLYQLTNFPSGFNADEAALGYNAYSLMTTGRDEHGHSWPVNLESFGDFKPALYSYILIPFIKVFGLTDFAVRLPSALFGILAIVFIYLLTREVISSEVGLISALILAVSPWHLHFSRGGWEVNVATTLILISIWSFVKWLKSSKHAFLTLCVFGFVLSMYTYQSARLLAPALGLGLSLLYFSRLIKYPKALLTNGILLVVLLIPLAVSIIRSDAASRFSGVGLLADEGPINRANELRGQDPNPNSKITKVLHNRYVEYTLRFLHNYTDHFQGDYLFINGDTIQRNRVPETGLFYLTDALFLILGIVYLIKHSTPHSKILWLWLFISPLAAAVTFQTPHALRTHSMVIPMTILIAQGIHWFLKNWKMLGICLLSFIYLWQISRYLHEYYVHYPQTYPAAWEYGFKELVTYTESVKDNYSKVLVTDKYDQPYILFLFYSKFPPKQFQNNHTLSVRDKYNFSTVRDYDKYHFTSTTWDNVRDTHSALIVTAPGDLPVAGFNIVKTIYFPNGQPAFNIISN